VTRPDEDDVWRSIVENYGERPVLDDLGDPDGTRDGAGDHTGDHTGDDRDDPGDHTGGSVATPPPPAPDPRPAAPAYDDPEDRFVPPTPPPLPRPTGLRGAAWVGIFGSPLLVLIGIVVPVDLPSSLDLALVAWFVGSFVYLVATMRRRPPDPWDDGSRV